jgi:hypothetical protein
VSRWSDLFAELSRNRDIADSIDTIGSNEGLCQLSPLCQQGRLEKEGRSATVIVPLPLVERVIPSACDEPLYEMPCEARRGRIERRGSIFLHFCIVCGAWGAFGYGVSAEHPGRWYCSAHRP